MELFISLCHKFYLEGESDIRAVLPAFRLLKPLNDDLEFYKGEYRKMIEKRIEDGSLEKRLPEVSDVFMDEDFSQCGYARLMEIGPDGNETGRYLIEVHGKIPFSDLY